VRKTLGLSVVMQDVHVSMVVIHVRHGDWHAWQIFDTAVYPDGQLVRH